jgi:hypothetical protein
MTAPAAPRIAANQDGTNAYVRWRPVDTATSYDLYISEDGGARGLESQYDDTDELEGWFFAVIGPYNGHIIAIDVTALNNDLTDNESVPSNVVVKNLLGPGHEIVPTHAEAMQHGRI